MSTNTHHADNVVVSIVNGWRGATAVSVVSSVNELPVVAPGDTRGLYKGGETWIVANTQPTWQVAQTLAHEMLGHHSMRKTLGAGWRPFMHAIQAGLRSGDPQLQVARGMVRSAYVDDSGAFNLSAVSESDEIAALVAELGFDTAKGRLAIHRPIQKVAAATAGQFAREALFMDKPATFQDLEGALLTAEHTLRHGGPLWGLGYRWRRWYASAMSKPWDPNQPPMSMRESQNLLQAEKDRATWWSEMQFGWDSLVLLGSVILGVGLVGVLVLQLLGVFSKLFQ